MCWPCLVIAILIGVPALGHAGWRDWDRRQKLVATNTAAVGLISAWGLASWDYGEYGFQARSEGWFGENTNHGGADKLGHFYSGYALGQGLSGLYRSFGYSGRDAAAYGALSSWGLLAYMELGDAFSRFGLSYEDVIMNTAGATASYVLDRNPVLSRTLDLRVEYLPKDPQADVFTDYDSLKFLAAVKLEGIRALPRGPWDWLEVHVGYYTRNYGVAGYVPQRYLYAGIGLNVSRLFRRHGYKRTAKVLEYVQVPYTAIEARRGLNH